MADWLPERLPEDIDAERSFLATCCAPGSGFSASEAVFSMAEDDFVHPAHRAVFRALHALLSRQEEVNSLTLKDQLDQDGNLNRVGGYTGLVELLAGEDVERPWVLADVIRRKAKLRRLVHLGAKLVRQAAAEDDDPEALIAPLMTEAEDVIASGRRAKWEPAGSSIIGTLEREGFLTDDPKDRADGRAVFSVGLPSLDRVMKRLKRNMVVIAARPKCGKCFGRGTQILMWDGSIKTVEDVVDGDLVMGPDSSPRIVSGTTQGEETLYRITLRNGDSFVCNASHILSLQANATINRNTPTDSIVNISVRDYLNQGTKFKHNTKAYKSSAIHFPNPPSLDIPPYILGLWLGDGTTGGTSITTPDPEVVSAWSNYASTLGYRISVADSSGTRCPTYRIANERGQKNCLRDMLRNHGIFEDKTIPSDYLIASEYDRLELLAGMLDTDGHWNGKSYEWCSVKPAMAKAFEFLCRSLGFACKVRPTQKTCTNTGVNGTYWAGCVSGLTQRIPCRIARKSAKDKITTKNVLRLAFKIEAIGEGSYFGFEVDQDHLFLLADFTVVHNTTLMVKSAWKQACAGHMVGIASGEMTEQEVQVVLTAHALGADQDAVAAGNLTPEQWRRLGEFQSTLDNIYIYAFEPTTGWALIEATIRRAIHQYGLTIVYLDYFGLVGKPPGQFFNEAARSAMLSQRMKALPKSTGIVFVVLVQINRNPGDGAEPSRSDIRDTGQIEQDMGLGIFLWRQPTKDMERLRAGQQWEYLAKVDGNRFGPDYVKVEFDMLGATANLRERENETRNAYQAAACAPAAKQRHTPPPLNL